MPSAERWDLWYPEAGATRLPFARGRLDATGVLLVHAAPPVLDVDIRDDDGHVIAQGRGLARTLDSPIARLKKRGVEVFREDAWPDESDIGRPVILPGGEVGILVSWWNAADRSEWRWRIELANRR